LISVKETRVSEAMGAVPRGLDLILSTQRIPRGRYPISSTQRIFAGGRCDRTWQFSNSHSGFAGYTILTYNGLCNVVYNVYFQNVVAKSFYQRNHSRKFLLVDTLSSFRIEGLP
jgi:hypothetical protein